MRAPNASSAALSRLLAYAVNDRHELAGKDSSAPGLRDRAIDPSAGFADERRIRPAGRCSRRSWHDRRDCLSACADLRRGIYSSSATACRVVWRGARRGVSMGWSEALSDTGEQTGRGSAVVRRSITRDDRAGGLFHTIPFLISDCTKPCSWRDALAFELSRSPGCATAS